MSTKNTQNSSSEKDWRKEISRLTAFQSDDGPIHTRVSKALSKLIDDGFWLPGERIPGERDLAQHFEISSLTANKSVTTLERQGKLFRKGGRGGTVVASIPEASFLRLAIAMHCAPSQASTDTYSIGILRGIQSALAKERFDTSVSFIDEWSASEIGEITRQSLSGVLMVAPQEGRRQDILKLAELGIPTVVLGASWPTSSVPTIDSDNFQGMDAALDYLTDLGHTRIACIYAWPDSSNHRDRLQAFRLYAARNKPKITQNWIVEAVPDSREGNHNLICPGLEQVLGSLEPPTAIVATDYQSVQCLLASASKLSLVVPDDLSIITFDAPYPVTSLNLLLTTVDQPLEAMGTAAVRALVSLCSRRERTTDVVFSLKVNERQSCSKIC